MKKDKKSFVESGRVLVKFNTGTREHRSLKDYTRKVKHKNKQEE